MATTTDPVDLTGIRDPQKPLAILFGLVLVVVGVADAVGVLVTDGLFLGVFAIGLWLDIVFVLTGLLGLFLSTYAGAGTLFDKLGGVIFLVLFLVGMIAVLAGVGGVNWPTVGLLLVLALVVGLVGFEGGRRRPV